VHALRRTTTTRRLCGASPQAPAPSLTHRCAHCSEAARHHPVSHLTCDPFQPPPQDLNKSPAAPPFRSHFTGKPRLTTAPPLDRRPRYHASIPDFYLPPESSLLVCNTSLQSRVDKMAVANHLRIAVAAPTTTPALSAARPLGLHSYGPMAVMTSPAFDKSPSDLKASALAPADGMALDSEANG
jgi:hypothetical protein